jgi:hypothetical protein
MSSRRLSRTATGGLRCLTVALLALLIGSTASSCGGSGGQTSSATGTDTGENKAVTALGSGKGSGQTPQAQPPSVPVRFSGSGSLYSVYFLVNTSTVTASYSYDCSSTGGSGFAAYMISGSPSSPGYDAQTIADVPDTAGSANVTLYPQDTSSYYYFQVNSECAWAIVVSPG